MPAFWRMKAFDVLKRLLFHGYLNVHETGRNSIRNQAAEELERELAEAESRTPCGCMD